nr:ribonuclease H-like domain-containing protein [Tanacetum cinerariifolium]
MDLETAQTTITAKLPILKQGEYDMWRLKIEQYFQIKVYALWDVIENGNSLKLAAQTTTNVDVSTANTQVSPASTQVSNATTQVSTANLSDASVYAFLANQPNGSQLVHEDLVQIHEDDLEEMDLKWSDTAGYDKSKVECFNCHKLRHFSRECKQPRNQDIRNMNQDNSRRTINIEETSSKAMVAIDGVVFD